MRNLLIVLLLPLAACVTMKNQVDLDQLLKSKGPGAFVAGTTVGLGEGRVVNRRDFIYAVDFTDDDKVVFTHHVTTHMAISREGIFTAPVNISEFDLEGLVFAHDALVVTSRQGILRLLAPTTGKLLREYSHGVALTRAALDEKRNLLAVGTAAGRVLLFSFPALAFVGQGRIHDDEVRDLRFLPDGRLLSVGFDGKLVVLTIAQGGPSEVHVLSSALESGQRVFLAHLDGARAVNVIRDERLLTNVITTAAVKRLGLKATTEKATVATPLGERQVPVVELGELAIRYLSFGAQRAALCDVCLPPGAELGLGQPVLQKALFADDVARDEIIVKSVPDGAVQIASAQKLVVQKSIALPGPATAIDVAKTGAVIACYSHARAERTREIYEAEKAGQWPPLSPASATVLVDIDAGTLGKRFVGHRGFTSTCAISPDGETIASGGWDSRVVLFDVKSGVKITERTFAWIIRDLAFRADGQELAVAAWTPANPLGDGASKPALVVYPVVFKAPTAEKR